MRAFPALGERFQCPLDAITIFGKGELTRADGTRRFQALTSEIWGPTPRYMTRHLLTGLWRLCFWLVVPTGGYLLIGASCGDDAPADDRASVVGEFVAR